MAWLRSKWAWLLAALLAGLVVGWFGIGWGVWAPAPKEPGVADLRGSARDEYLSMVAESYAANGDITAVEDQLDAWQGPDLALTLSNLQTRLAGSNPQLAAQVHSMALALVPPATPTDDSQQAAVAAAAGTPDAAGAPPAGIAAPAGTGTPAALPSATDQPDELPSPEPSDTPAPVVGTPTATPVPIDLNKTENILVLGVDDRSNMVAWRTDTIMVVIIDHEHNQLGIVSIPRDLWVNIPGHGMDRINAADYAGEKGKYPGGGPALVRKVVQDSLGIPTQHYVQFKQEGFIALVDALGGVTVHLDCPLYEKTPDSLSRTGYRQFSLPAGDIQLDGVTAKKFVTFRYIQGDFGRQRRQQQLIWAIRNRALKGDVLPRIPELWSTLSDTFVTDLSLFDVIRLAAIGINLRGSDIHAASIGPDLVRDYTTPEGAMVLLLRDRNQAIARARNIFAAKQLAEINKAPASGCPAPPAGFVDLRKK